MVPERDVDPAELYEHERLAFVELLRSVPPSQLARPVAATPEWTVRDVLAHVVGITVDLNHEDFGQGDPAGWTRAQVERRRDATVDDLAAEWDREAPLFETGLRLFGHDMGAHYLGDLLQHVLDVHTSLGTRATVDHEVLAVATDFYLRSVEETLVTEEIGAVEVQVDGESWRLGDGDVVASVAGTRFEIFRSLGGRRTIDEIRSLDWAGDVDRVLPLLSRYPTPSATLGERVS